MINISQTIKEILNKDTEASPAFNRGILNLSAYSRQIQKDVQRLSLKQVKIRTIVTALSRLQKKVQVLKNRELKIEILNISIHSDLEELTFERTKKNFKKIREFFFQIPNDFKAYSAFTQGVSEITVILDSQTMQKLKTKLKESKPVFQKKDLTAITLRFPPKFINIPNLLYKLTQRLAVKNINIIEMISTFSEITYIVEKKDSQLAIDQFFFDL
ncbi:MAG: hypothetical protein GF335_03610 [Candidatus Moranbacteria bacterium]|nr:hypothetical protein [Candidatus Moranbacteria bacterium]